MSSISNQMVVDRYWCLTRGHVMRLWVKGFADIIVTDLHVSQHKLGLSSHCEMLKMVNLIAILFLRNKEEM